MSIERGQACTRVKLAGRNLRARAHASNAAPASENERICCKNNIARTVRFQEKHEIIVCVISISRRVPLRRERGAEERDAWGRREQKVNI